MNQSDDDRDFLSLGSINGRNVYSEEYVNELAAQVTKYLERCNELQKEKDRLQAELRQWQESDHNEYERAEDLRGNLFDLDSAYRKALARVDHLAQDWHSLIWETTDGQQLRAELERLAREMEETRPSPLRDMWTRLETRVNVQRAEIARLQAERESLADLYVKANEWNVEIIARVESLQAELAKFDGPYYYNLEQRNAALTATVEHIRSIAAGTILPTPEVFHMIMRLCDHALDQAPGSGDSDA